MTSYFCLCQTNAGGTLTGNTIRSICLILLLHLSRSSLPRPALLSGLEAARRRGNVGEAPRMAPRPGWLRCGSLAFLSMAGSYMGASQSPSHGTTAARATTAVGYQDSGDPDEITAPIPSPLDLYEHFTTLQSPYLYFSIKMFKIAADASSHPLER